MLPPIPDSGGGLMTTLKMFVCAGVLALLAAFMSRSQAID